ncbi:DNA polymerase IV [Holzapfeliella sp. He02]|uniref:DNA polymerase IV n=1 Tax=Holzapfeliella saturejae TaxID=3082953 RepID=A0ABU8SFL3_9LACO
MTVQDWLPKNKTDRKIIHLDMDAFYASVEELKNPQLKQKALVVAHDPRKNNGHGVITTSNYRARKYGVFSAMPATKAIENIPKNELVFVKPDFKTYRKVSKQIHCIFQEVTDLVETVAFDEAYLDVTQNKLGTDKTTIDLASYLQQRILKETGLTCSVGISYNKFLAKLGSEYAKPFGRTIILPEMATEFLKDYPINQFPGVGKKTLMRLHEHDIYTHEDLITVNIHDFLRDFKRAGYDLLQRAFGIDLRPVKANRLRKSYGKESTFLEPIHTKTKAKRMLKLYCDEIQNQLTTENLKAQTVVFKIRDSQFNTATRRQTLAQAQDQSTYFYQVACQLLDEFDTELTVGVRLLGVSVTNILDFEIQSMSLPLFQTR